MANFFVTTSGSDANGGTNDTSDAWATPGHAAGQIGVGDDVYIQGPGTYNLTNTTPNTAGGPVVLSGIAGRCSMNGYETTPGDNCPTGQRPVISANGNAPSIMFELNGNNSQIQAIRSLVADCPANEGVTTLFSGTGNGSYLTTFVFNVLARGNTGSRGFYRLRCIGSGAENQVAAHGFLDCDCIRCYAYNCGNSGFQSVRDHRYEFCLAQSCNVGLNYLGTSFNTFVSNSIFLDNVSHGLNFANGGCQAINTVSISNGGAGFNIEIADSCSLCGCASYNNTSGRTVNAPSFDDDPILLTVDPFTDSANQDFTLNDDAGGGVLLKSAAIQTPSPIYPSPATQSYLDINAYQPQATSGGSIAGVAVMPRLRRK